MTNLSQTAQDFYVLTPKSPSTMAKGIRATHRVLLAPRLNNHPAEMFACPAVKVCDCGDAQLEIS